MPLLIRVDVGLREVQTLWSDELLHEGDQLGLSAIWRANYQGAAVTIVEATDGLSHPGYQRLACVLQRQYRKQAVHNFPPHRSHDVILRQFQAFLGETGLRCIRYKYPKPMYAAREPHKVGDGAVHQTPTERTRDAQPEPLHPYGVGSRTLRP